MLKISLECMSFEEIQMVVQTRKNNAASTRELLRNTSDKLLHEDDYNEVVASLGDIIKELIRRLEEVERGSLAERDICSQLTECYGAIGGACRAWEDFSNAASAYLDGRKYEERIEELGGSPDSYCLVQSTVNLILDSPSSLVVDRESGEGIIKKLNSDRCIILDQINGQRYNDPWAYADLSLVVQLIFGDAESEWDKLLDDLKPSSFLMNSTWKVIVPLLEKLRPFIPSNEVSNWEYVIKRLSRF